MKRILFLLIVLFATGMVSAQQREASITVVGDAVHDFGDIKESDGAVSHSFTVLNNGELPLVISRVIGSCGCTTPEWTKEPIKPGKTGKVVATFDPKNRPGPFNKNVQIATSAHSEKIIVRIIGTVE